jgi:lipopolysaccharide assembly outer membrane protein LptD (OstA)
MNQTRMLGDVTIVVNGVTLHADEAIYTPATRTVILKGAVTAVLPEAK